MYLHDLIKLANAWQNMGDALQEQAQTIIDDGFLGEINPDAIYEIVQWLEGAEKIADAARDDELGDEITAVKEKAHAAYVTLTEGPTCDECFYPKEYCTC